MDEKEILKRFHLDTISAMVTVIDDLTEETYFNTTDMSILREEITNKVIDVGQIIETKLGKFKIVHIAIELLNQLSPYYPEMYQRGRRIPYSIHLKVFVTKSS